jgi:hypothetical protein
MQPATADTLMQVAGIAIVIVPMLALAVGLAISSRRRKAAEHAADRAAGYVAPPPAVEAEG